MEKAVKACKQYGGIAEVAMSYTVSPVHTEEYFVKLAKQIEDLGADTICIKDMANLLLPYDAYSLVSKLKKATKLPIHLHTHNTTGTGDMVYLKAIEAGCDIVDTALSPLANGTSQPARRHARTQRYVRYRHRPRYVHQGDGSFPQGRQAPGGR